MPSLHLHHGRCSDLPAQPGAGLQSLSASPPVCLYALGSLCGSTAGPGSLCSSAPASLLVLFDFCPTPSASSPSQSAAAPPSAASHWPPPGSASSLSEQNHEGKYQVY